MPVSDAREWKVETGIVSRGGNAGMAWTAAICPCGWRLKRNGRGPERERLLIQEAWATHPTCEVSP